MAKVGYCAIIGRPNVGKSSFLNHILAYRLAAVSSRPHTTRRSFLGIYSTDNSQIIFTDTPGVHQQKNKMQEKMISSVNKAIRNNDVVLLIVDSFRKFGLEDELVLTSLKDCKKPVIIVFNKIDICSESNKQELIEIYHSYFSSNQKIFFMSCLEKKGCFEVVEEILSHFEEGPFLYDKDDISNSYIRDISCELIREAAIENLNLELPHSVAVFIDKWQENEKKIIMYATFYVERESQKIILIGKKGSMIDLIKRQAIKNLRCNIDKNIDLRLFVKIKKNWQNDESFLKNYGIVDE